MKFFICLVLAFFISRSSFSQNCHCKDNLDFVIAKVRENYAGYRDKVTPANRALLDALTDSLLKAADTAAGMQDPAACEAIINKYIGFFRDGHMYIYREQPVGQIDKDSVRRLYAGWPRVAVTEQSLPQQLRPGKHRSALEGMWVNDKGGQRFLDAGPVEILHFGRRRRLPYCLLQKRS